MNNQSEGGYNWAAGKSNRAVEAETNGLITVGAVSRRLGIPSAMIKQFVRASEWHHTSGWFNQTDYFDCNIVAATFGLYNRIDREVDDIEGDDELAVFVSGHQNTAATNALAHYKKNGPVEQIHYDAIVEWLEWSGRGEPPEERKIAGATVRVKGCFATISKPGLITFRKKLTTKGFSFTTKEILAAEEKAAAEKTAKWEASLVEVRAESKRRKAAFDLLDEVIPVPGYSVAHLDLQFGESKVWAALDSKHKVVEIRAMDCPPDSTFEAHRNKCRAELAELGLVRGGEIYERAFFPKDESSFGMVQARLTQTFKYAIWESSHPGSGRENLEFDQKKITGSHQRKN